jgi:transposase
MIALSAALGKTGMRVGAKPKSGPGKVQIKVTLALKGLLPSHAKVFTEQPFLSEERALKQVIDESELKDGDVVVFDRGVKGRKAFQSLNERGCQFVTRLREPRYEVFEVHQEVKGLTDGNLRFVDDLIVHLYQSGETKILPAPFRLVIAQAIQGEHAGKTFYFLTNILEMSAAQIAQAYLRRWDIEVFFRFLKQEMGLRNLLFHNENGIKAVLYLRLFTATLFRLYMWLNKRTDFKISKRVLQSELEIAIAKSLAVLFIQEREFMEQVNPDLKKYILPLSP